MICVLQSSDYGVQVGQLRRIQTVVILISTRWLSGPLPTDANLHLFAALPERQVRDWHTVAGLAAEAAHNGRLLRRGLRRRVYAIANLDHLASKRRHSLGVVSDPVVTGDTHVRVADCFNLVHPVD
jgi:hypothetical protein